MLALPTFPPTVFASANRLFRLLTEGLGEVESNEWEGIRPTAPNGRSAFDPSGLGDGGPDMSAESPSAEPINDFACEAALSKLAVRDIVAIFSICCKT